MAQYVLEVIDNDTRRDDVARVESDTPFPAFLKGESIEVEGHWVVVKEVQHVIHGDTDGMRAYTKVFGKRINLR